MRWSEIRESYPDQWVKLRVLASHESDGYLYIDDMDVIRPISTDQEATIELTKSTGENLVFHTSHEIIRTKIIRNLGLYRRIPN